MQVDKHGLTPGSAVVLVGDNPASATYISSKKNTSAQSGIRSFDHRLLTTISEAELLALIVA
jgi:methylenetetrahydrofolate dehydrogenase (NADP+) / methenyltetrahydrofolate cyclohydrolase